MSAGRRWRLDPIASRISFRSKAAGIVPVRGAFAVGLNGMAEEAPDGLLRGLASVPVAQLRTGLGRRDRHLTAPDFLDAAAHPLIELAVEGLTWEPGEQRVRALVHIKGRVVPVDVTAQVRLAGADLRAQLHGTFLRADAGITPPFPAAQLVDPRIRFDVAAVGHRTLGRA